MERSSSLSLLHTCTETILFRWEIYWISLPLFHYLSQLDVAILISQFPHLIFSPFSFFPFPIFPYSYMSILNLLFIIYFLPFLLHSFFALSFLSFSPSFSFHVLPPSSSYVLPYISRRCCWCIYEDINQTLWVWRYPGSKGYLFLTLPYSPKKQVLQYL